MIKANPTDNKQNATISFPIIISVIGPKKVGKTTLNKSIASYFLSSYNEFLYGPLVIVVEETLSYLFIESPPDILSISNLSKASDVIILVIDGYFGLELEIFEFISLFETHGVSRVLAVFTHIDLFSNWKKLKKSKKRLKTRLKKELNNCTKIFYLTGITLKEMYFPREVSNITRFFSRAVIRTTKLQKSLSFVIVTRLDLDLKKGKKKILLSGFQKGKEIGKISPCIGFIPGMGKVSVKKLLKYTESKKNKKKALRFRKIKSYFFAEKKSIDFLQKHKNGIKIQTLLLNFLILFKTNEKGDDKISHKKFSEIVDSDKFKFFTKLNKKKIKRPTIGSSTFSTKKMNFFDSSNLILEKHKKKLNCRQTNFIELVLEELNEQFYRYFDPVFSLILCIDPNMHFGSNLTQAIVNRHKWNKKIIRTQDIIFLSIGWKFFETSIFFFKEKHYKKAYIQKCLSYRLPSLIGFMSHFEFSGIGIVGIFNPGNNFCSLNKGTIFNIIFSGIITQPIENKKIFKKVNLKGIIFKSFRKTCCVKNMFSNEIEVLRFIGSVVYNIPGKRGIIKKPIKDGPPGSFRVLSETNMKKGDSVFLKLLIPVKINRKIENSNLFSIPNDFKEMGIFRKK